MIAPSIKSLLMAQLLSVVIFNLSFSASAQADTVGQVQRLQRFAYQTPPGQTRAPVFRMGAVFRDAKLETVPSGGLQVRFVDGSMLTLGGGSSVTIDKFVYQSAQPSAQSLQLAKGVFRFVSGSMPKDSVRLKTPAVSIGIRGTDLKVTVNADGSTSVYFEHGEGFVEVPGGQSIPVRTGELIQVSASGGVTPPRRTQYRTGDQAVDQGLQAFGVIFGGPNAGSGGNGGIGGQGVVDSTTSP